MTIHEYKVQFEEVMSLATSLQSAMAEQAWGYFKNSILEFLHEDYCEEIGFVVNLHSYYDGTRIHTDVNLFSIYFGRLIDNNERQNGNWNVAEIDCYFLYHINQDLLDINARLQKSGFQIEDAYCRRDSEEVIRRKINAIFTFADEKAQLWDAVRDLKPAKVDYHFWIY